MPIGFSDTACRVAPELVDELMDAYVEWRQECIAVHKSYERWSSVPSDERRLAFAAYRAALDREELASSVYADRTSRVADALTSRRRLLKKLFERRHSVGSPLGMPSA